MKKLISLIMALCMICGVVAALAACDGDDDRTLDNEDLGAISPQTTNTSETTEGTTETSADTTQDTTSETLPPVSNTTESESESLETTEATEETTETQYPAEEWPAEEILAAVGAGVPDYEGYFYGVYTEESPFTTVLPEIEISILGTDTEDLEAYKAVLVQNGYVVVNDTYQKEIAGEKTIVIEMSETIGEEDFGIDFDICVYKKEGTLSAWPTDALAQNFGDSLALPAITGATSYDFEIIEQEMYGIVMNAVTICAYGADSDDMTAYETALVNDGYVKDNEEFEGAYIKTFNDGLNQMVVYVESMPTNDGVLIGLVCVPNLNPCHTLPENITIQYSVGGAQPFNTGTKIGKDYLLQSEEGNYFYKYDATNDRWTLWMQEAGASSWTADEEYYYEDVAEVEAAVFGFIVNSGVVNACTDVNETSYVNGIEAKKYTMAYDVYTLYFLQDPETKLILESGIVGAEVLSSKVVASDTEVTSFTVNLPR